MKIYEELFPVIIDECEFYEEFVLMAGKSYNYKELTAIMFNHNKDTINGITKLENIILVCIFYESSDQLFDTADEATHIDEVTFTYNGNMFLKSKEKKDKIIFIYDLLARTSFEMRLDKYLFFLKRDGYFLIGNIKFHNNGDIYEDDKFQGNIQKAFLENKLINGVKFTTYKSGYQNPYIFAIVKGRKMMGFLEDRFEFYNQFNKDVFDFLVAKCIQTGSMI